MISERTLALNAKWLKDYSEQVAAIEHYKNLLQDEQLYESDQAFVKREIEERQSDLEGFKKLIQSFTHILTRLLYLKYVEGYTVEAAADMIGKTHNYCANLHAAFTKYLKRGEDG